MEYKVTDISSPNDGIVAAAIFTELDNAMKFVRISIEKGRVMQIEARKARD